MCVCVCVCACVCMLCACVSVCVRPLHLNVIQIQTQFIPYVLLQSWVLIREHSHICGHIPRPTLVEGPYAVSNQSHLFKVDQTINKRFIANVEKVCILGNQGHEGNHRRGQLGLVRSQHLVVTSWVLARGQGTEDRGQESTLLW